MNQVIYLVLLANLISVLSLHAQQESTLRPRVQLAQLREELDGIFSTLHVSTTAEVHRVIKQLQHQARTLEAKNTRLEQELTNVKAKHAETVQRNHQLTQSLKKLHTTKQQITSLAQQLGAVADRLSTE